MIADLRFALRQLVKAPGFTAIVIIILALSIGACTVIVSLINGILLHPLHAPEPERLVTLRTTRLPDTTDLRTSVPDFLDWKNQTQSFAVFAANNNTSMNFTREGEPLRLEVLRVTANYYQILGAKPMMGRAFLPEEETPGKNRVVILGYSFWKNAFGGAPDVIGRIVLLNGEPYTVVGINEPDMDQLGDRAFVQFDVMIPLAFRDAERTNRGWRPLNVQARLNPGVTVAQAQAEMDALTARLATQYPDTNKGGGALAIPTIDYQTRNLRPMLWELLVAVVGVLLIACANIANLLLARATTRQREISVRAALGAGRTRLVRQLLVESLLLALLGGVSGVLLAIWGLEVLRAAPFTAMLVRIGRVELDMGILGFTLALSVITGLVFGLAPAWLASRVDLNESLKQGARGSTESGSRGSLRSALVVFEVAATLVLLASAGLLFRSFVNLASVDPGFNPTRVTTMSLVLRSQKYAVDGIAAKAVPVLGFTDALLERLRSLSGVEAAGVIFNLPVGSASSPLPFNIAGRAPLPKGEWPIASVNSASPDYFKAMGIRLLSGRKFTAHDDAQSPRVVLINETLARSYFANQNPVGQFIEAADDGLTNGSWGGEIVGIVSDVAERLSQPVPPQIYSPWAQRPTTLLNLVVRTSGDPAAIISAMKAQVYAVDPSQPVGLTTPLSRILDRSISRPRFAIQMVGLFSVIALVIAAVGIYGVISYTVGQRTTEFGIRMALGAQSSDVLGLVLTHGGRLVGIGLGLGLIGALITGRLLQTQLFHVRPYDPLILGTITLVFASVTAFACWLPARRATRVDPMIALRAE